MKKLLISLMFMFSLMSSAYAGEGLDFFKLHIFNNDTREIKSLLNAQVRYANRTNFDKFISTFDKNYKNSDGFDLETYSKLVQDLWQTYDNIEYDMKIKDITVNNDEAAVCVTETAFADVPAPVNLEGILTSESDSIYYLKKTDGDWKVISDKVLSETTSLLYGSARDLNIKLTAPLKIRPGKEYTASLEFTPPDDVIAIASIASDKVGYPQRQAKEVFRKFPDDNILERIFVSNDENANEYVIASIGLTKAEISDLNIQLSLTGFGYKIIRVNVVPEKNSEDVNDKDR